MLISLTALPLSAQDWVAGVEATANTSYSYVTHYSRSGPMIYWQTVSYLTYRVNDGGTDTSVSSPGVAIGATYRWQQRNTSAGIGAGYEMRWTERRREGQVPVSETEQGPIVEADLSQRFAARTSGRIAARYSGANEWRAASAEVRQEIGARLRVGPQVIWQGNEDIKVLSAGAFVEIPLGDTWLQLRGGQARIEHRDGTTQNEPYFSAGIVVPF
ncbi:MAG TPA: cellulose biosynthesis protein BcsS [Thermoanaerobaculia bacterium]|nr:cellulose biosynthesis protein BcsS [Thermoanaerobaculia bacterium]